MMKIPCHLRSIVPFLLVLTFAALILLVGIPAHAQPGPSSSIHLQHTTAQGFTLTIQAPDATITPQPLAQGTCLQVQTSEAVDGEDADDSSIPWKVFLLGAPPQARVQVHLQPIDTIPLAARSQPCGLEQPPQPQVIDLGYMRSQRIVRVEIPLVQLEESTGQWSYWRRFQVDVTFEGDISGQTIPEPPSFEAMFQDLLVNYDQARGLRQQPATVPPVLGAWTPPSPAWRVLVDEPGIYRLTYTDLRNAGLPVDTLDPRTLQIFNYGKEVAIAVTGEEDSRLDPTDALYFFGQGVDTRYTDTNVYWLTYGQSRGKRMSHRYVGGHTGLATSYLETARYELNRSYVSTLPMRDGHDHWFGYLIRANGGQSGHRDITLDLDHIINDGTPARMSLMLGGNIVGSHHLRVYVNGHQVLDDTWHNRELYQHTVTLDVSYLQNGTNTIRLELVNDDPSHSYDQVYLDWVELTYPRQLLTKDDHLIFNKPDNTARTFQIEGFTSSQLALYDITHPDDVQILDGWRAASTGSGFRLEFTDMDREQRAYWAGTPSQFLSPKGIQATTPLSTPLLSTDQQADYLIIYHPDFQQAIQPLIQQRQAQGYRVRAVTTQDVYDAFGYGMMSAEAIRDFLAYAYAHWQRPAPAYVLLVGDGTYDMRQYLSSSMPTYLPPYLASVDPSLGETATDNRFVAVAGNDELPDMHIGRLPANSPDETTVMVDKILAYEQVTPDDAWTHNILFVTDNLEGGGGNFYQLSDAIADGYLDPPHNTAKLIPETYQRIKLYLDRTCASGQECQQRMNQTLNDQGALFVSYIGHGTDTYWASEKIWTISAIRQLHNGPKFPIMLPMTCNEGYFQKPRTGSQSASEASLRLPHHGAVASWAPTGFGLSTGHDYLERGFFRAVYHINAIRDMGAATTAGKLYLAANAPPGQYDDLIDTFLLLGDPGLRLPIVQGPAQQVFFPCILKE